MNQEIVNFFKNLALLCVEDDPTVQSMYTRLFAPLFKKVYFARDGQEGLEIFRTNPVDLVLTDYMMPKMNGIEMIRDIRSIDMKVPIFLITAFEDLTLLRQALELHTTGFIKKPVTFESLFNNLEMAVKSILADKILLQKQVELLKYINYQESLTLKKQQKIIQNEIAKEQIRYKVDVYFQPKDLISGDSYTIKKHSQGALFFLIDGMGKGLSASVTAMLGSSFVNYQLHKDPSIDLHTLIEEFLEFSKLFLLEEEVISCIFLHITSHSFSLASFGMPPIFLLHDRFYKIPSNNPPFSSYTKSFHIDQYPLDFHRMMLYTDGLIESMHFLDIEQLFLKSKNFKEFKTNIEKKTSFLEDDITIIYYNKLNSQGESSPYEFV